MFDSLKAVKELVEAGFTQKQAEVLITITMEIFSSTLVQKEDLASAKREIISEMRSALR